MFKQEVVNLGKQMHPALAVAIFIATVDTVVLVGIDHQVELLAVADHSFDELHGVLVVDVVVAAAVAEQVIALMKGLRMLEELESTPWFMSMKC